MSHGDLDMIRTGKVLTSVIGANKDGDTNVRLLNVELTDSDDIQTIEYYDDGGCDYRPPDGAEVVVVDVTPSHRVAIAVDDLITPSVAKGEKLIYSVGSDGAEKAGYIYLKNGGNVELNGLGDHAVRYAELEIAFNELKGDLNAVIAALNSHEHITPAGNSTGKAPPYVPLVDSTADVSGAKIDEVEVSK